MKLTVKVKPGSKKALVKKISEFEYEVSVNAPAKEGKANKALIDILAGYFDVPKRRVVITGGDASRHKRIEIQE